MQKKTKEHAEIYAKMKEHKSRGLSTIEALKAEGLSRSRWYYIEAKMKEKTAQSKNPMAKRPKPAIIVAAEDLPSEKLIALIGSPKTIARMLGI